jgi:hypothetical protein
MLDALPASPLFISVTHTNDTLSTKTLFLISTLFHSDTGRGFELPETLGLIEQIRPDDQLSSIRTNSTTLM